MRRKRNMQHRSDNKVPRVKSRSRIEINKIATDFVYGIDKEALIKPKRIELIPILEYGYIRKTFGFSFGVEDLSQGMEGYTDFSKKMLVLSEFTYDAIQKNLPRAIFTGFHEISHVILHRGQLQNRTVEEVNKERFFRSDLKAYEDPEWQADECAAAIQIPLQTAVPLLKSGATEIDFMKIYGVSRKCAEVRIAKLTKLVKENPRLVENQGLFF